MMDERYCKGVSWVCTVDVGRMFKSRNMSRIFSSLTPGSGDRCVDITFHRDGRISRFASGSHL